MLEKQREELLKLHEILSGREEDEQLEDFEENGVPAHKPHRRISRYGRSHHRFNRTMKGNK
ncbi:hypothetical protein FLP15_12125 [Lactococcus protaetiae]|uniref:Uncharacterized protein n=2 Tax=Lactococcus protaetiae TaxID=2592653 RepID=A0A514ZB12_9LACT|nr:hypothetical protein FLP15_12125 [Lactococcus protaetiae]